MTDIRFRSIRVQIIVHKLYLTTGNLPLQHARDTPRTIT
jgi:hypothetical protein